MPTQIENFKIIKFPEVNNLLGGVSKRTLQRWEKSGKFPKRIKLSEQSVGWILDDIHRWIGEKRLGSV